VPAPLEELLQQDLYIGRNAIERVFCRLKDCRRCVQKVGVTALRPSAHNASP